MHSSTVFDACLASNMAEANTGIINIIDCDPIVFDTLLECIYSDTVDAGILSAHGEELLRQADKYQLRMLTV